MFAPGTALRSNRGYRRSTAAENAHPIVHLGGHAVVADHRPRIVQANRFALDDEAPQGIACIGNQAGTWGISLAVAALVFSQGGQGRFERAAEPAERGDLLLRDLVVERRATLCS